MKDPDGRDTNNEVLMTRSWWKDANDEVLMAGSWWKGYEQ